jgi:hypothetical protein
MELDVLAREPAVRHTAVLQQIERWCDGVAINPDEVIRRRRVKAMLAE